MVGLVLQAHRFGHIHHHDPVALLLALLVRPWQQRRRIESLQLEEAHVHRDHDLHDTIYRHQLQPRIEN
jgi:hypothetical protein